MFNTEGEIKALRQQHLRVVLLSAVLVVMFFMVALLWVEQKARHDAKAQLYEQLVINVEHLRKRGVEKYIFFTRRLTENPAVIDAFKTGYSDELGALVHKEWELLKRRNNSFTGFNLFRSDGTLLLGTDKPGEDRNYLRELQSIVKEMHGAPMLKEGYGYCTSSSPGYCVMVPVYDLQGVYLGVIQFGFSPAFFLDGIKELTAYESALFVQKRYEKRMDGAAVADIAGYGLQYYSDSSVLQSLKNVPGSGPFPDGYDFNEGEKLYTLTVFDMKDFSGADAAKIAVLQDITKVSLHKSIDFGLIASLFFAMLVTVVLLLRRYNNRFIDKIIDVKSNYDEKIVENDIRLQYNESYLDTIFNTSPNLIITTDGRKMDRANSVMLEFTGYGSVEAFHAKHQNVYDLFEHEKGYLSSEAEGMNWLTFIGQYPEMEHHVRMKKDMITYTFSVKAQALDFDDKHRSVVIFSDVSALKESYEREQALKLDMIDNYENTLLSLVSMVEKRDTYTGGHSQRVAEYSKLLAKELGCSDRECDLLYRAGIMHDIGKMTTPDSVLLKPGTLSDLEYGLIKNHVSVGHEMLVKIPMYHDLAEIIRHHHERYDGKGYPSGIEKDEIPFLSRIMIVADAFDAMTTNRIYKGRKNVQEALKELREFSCKQFHPEVVEAAEKVFDSIDIEQSITQLPQNELEEERFAYFYKDGVTQVYNRSYLDFLLNANLTSRKYCHLTLVLLHNFSYYNEMKGWDAGDVMLRRFAEFLSEAYPDAAVFRVYGDDFVVLHKEYTKVDASDINDQPLVKENGLSVSIQSMDLTETKISDFKIIGKIVK